MRFIVAVVVAFALPACAGNPAPGEPGYPYNLDGEYRVRFSVEGEAYTGSAQLSTGVRGAVVGTFRITSPFTVPGELEGTVHGDTLTWAGDYDIPSQGCTGSTRGRGAIEEGGARASGRMTVDDSCFGRLTGRFSFRRAAP